MTADAPIDPARSASREESRSGGTLTKGLFVTKQKWVPLVLFLASFALFLLGNHSHGVWNRDESRYAVATREMIQTGDLIIPHFNGEVRYDKPILIYWLMAAPMKVLGVNEFSVRFPSALMGAFRVVLIYFLALSLGASRRASVLAGVMATLSFLLLLISKAATTDSTLVLTVVAAMFLFWLQVRQGFTWKRHVLFWAAIAFSGLVKGPPGILVVALGTVTFRLLSAWRRRRHPESPDEPAPTPFLTWLVRFAGGLAVLLLITLPWVIPAWVRTDGGFFAHSIGKHVIERAQTEMEGHGGSFFYYIPVALAAMLPFTALWVASIYWAWKKHRRVEVRFLWSWFLPGLILFSAVSTKLPHYIAPLLPAMILMGALWWTELEVGKFSRQVKRFVPSGWWYAGAIFNLVVGVGILVGIPLAIIGIGAPVGPVPVAIIAGLLGPGLILGAHFWWRRQPRRSLAWSAGGWILGLSLGFAFGLPAVNASRPSQKAGAWLQENAPEDTRLLMAEFDEPSLVFYGGGPFTTIGTGEPERAFRLLNDLQTPTALVTTADRWRKYQREYTGPPVSPRVSERYRVKGFYFERGEPLTLVIAGNW